MDRIVPQVFVVDRVVLARLQEAHQVMRFRNENAVLVQQQQNRLHDLVDVLDMGENIGGRDDFRRSASLRTAEALSRVKKACVLGMPA